MNSLLKCVALRDQLNNEKESPLKTQLDLALSSVLVLLSTYSKLASSSGTHSPSILSPLIRMDNTLSNASPATEFTFLTQLGFHVRVLKAVLMADLYTDEFNIKDASVCLHEARTLLNDWIEALNDFQKDMVVPLTVIRPLPVIERRNEDVASHAERGISTNGLLGGLFNSLTPQKESQQQPSHPHFHVTPGSMISSNLSLKSTALCSKAYSGKVLDLQLH
ncbi:hypothetical protein BCR33DRAFT_168982 [Rhizoclosmatium globosum]|uniref:Uncharacterized protein n=1 Tax=Rhizoclosmatium globosum TaxID=329046 RepID=A0A1Y2CEI0_9FUNG|nr:hypothetical protein BCR33DRAFT_168982 [Rhizoclosmatium globosum]|eukprot:ORY45470.1 hypothetical protein BCR33DRAFT_168982 [Rhizoclosmatium globosum]